MVPMTTKTQDLSALWKQILGLFQNEMSPTSFDTWLRPSRAVAFDGQTLTVAAPNAYARDWLESRLSNGLRRKLVGLLGRHVQVRFVVQPQGEPTPEEAAAEPASLPPPLPEEWLEAAPATEEAEEEDLPPLPPLRLHPRYTFETFVVGPTNEFAYAASRAVAERPGQTYNPLFIYGGVGLGKTHLLQAIARATRAAGYRVAYLSAEEFFNHFFQAIRNHQMDAFRLRFRRVDLLLVDDVHFLIGKERLQEEFFHTFNALYYEGRQIVFTADRPPVALAALEERLRSRFEWGLIVDIQPPDYETRLAILRAKAEHMGLRVPEEVLDRIARHLEGNIRTLEGALNRLRAYGELRGRPITLEAAEAILADLFPRKLQVDPQRLLRTVAEEFEVTVEQLMSTTRSRKVVLPRQVAMYLLREDARYSFPQIGHFFGGRDHTTVMYACEKIARAYERDETLRKRIRRIRERLYSAA